MASVVDFFFIISCGKTDYSAKYFLEVYIFLDLACPPINFLSYFCQYFLVLLVLSLLL